VSLDAEAPVLGGAGDLDLLHPPKNREQLLRQRVAVEAGRSSAMSSSCVASSVERQPGSGCRLMT
jgi:hypothetical protein